jgi:hypothetical protein
LTLVILELERLRLSRTTLQLLVEQEQLVIQATQVIQALLVIQVIQAIQALLVIPARQVIQEVLVPVVLVGMEQAFLQEILDHKVVLVDLEITAL